MEDTHKQQVQLWHSDTYWNDEFKNLGFCGTDNLTAGGAACTHYSEHIGYYDKDLNGLDGDSNTKGGLFLTMLLIVAIQDVAPLN